MCRPTTTQTPNATRNPLFYLRIEDPFLFRFAAFYFPPAHAHPNRPMPADRAEAPSIPQGEAAVPAAGPLAEPKEGWWLETSGGSHMLAEEAAAAVLSPVDSGMDCYRKHFLGHGENMLAVQHAARPAQLPPSPGLTLLPASVCFLRAS